MNNQQKLVIVVLVILGLLFFLGLGAGFRFNGSEREPDPASGKEPPRLVEVMDEWLAPFGPKLSLNGVSCNHQPVTQTFSLTQAAPECVLTFPAATDGAKSRKASLHMLGGPGISVHFAYKKPEHEPGKPPDPCRAAQPPGLNLIFAELGETPPQDCWVQKTPGKPVRIIALEKAATLRLICAACIAGLVRQVSLKFE